MATLIPSLHSSLRRMNAGEKRLAQRMEALLDGSAVCWYDVAFGPRYQRPDFVVLDPLHGLLVVEVRDWKLEQILSVGRTSISLLDDGACKDVANPLEQARQYAGTICQILDHDPLLRCQVGHGLVLCNISRKEFDTAQLGTALATGQVICKDEMTESAQADDFQQRLWRMSGEITQQPLNPEQVDRIRYHLFPELRIQQASLFPELAKTGRKPVPLLVMDLEQERLARSLGDGHRVIHGVAGSGKTMILAYRCTQLARNSGKPILVLCYNDSLAAKLEQLITDRRLLGRIIVRPFHSWCLDQLRLHRISVPSDGPGFPGRLVRSVTQAVTEQRIPAAQYGAVLIDEGHDFEPEWFKLLAQMVDPSNNSLLLLYDDAQSIYGKKRSRAFSFAKVGIQARGRTTILRVNYRNSAEVLEYAYSFAREVLTPEENTLDDDAVPFVSPQSSGRHGRTPTLTQCNSLADEARYIAQQLRLLHAQGCNWKDMALLYPAHFVGEAMAAELRAQQLPVEWQPATRFNPGHDSIKLMTLHSSKGLEFPVVAIGGLGFMPYQEDEAMEDTRLLYIGMTRAVGRLILTAHQSSEFVKQLLAMPHGAVNG
jgi:UvrD-like helicase C-terminal domain/AAA domain/Nuclease-related domain